MVAVVDETRLAGGQKGLLVERPSRYTALVAVVQAQIPTGPGNVMSRMPTSPRPMAGKKVNLPENGRQAVDLSVEVRWAVLRVQDRSECRWGCGRASHIHEKVPCHRRPFRRLHRLRHVRRVRRPRLQCCPTEKDARSIGVAGSTMIGGAAAGGSFVLVQGNVRFSESERWDEDCFLESGS